MSLRIVGIDSRGLPVFEDDLESGQAEADAETRLRQALDEKRRAQIAQALEQAVDPVIEEEPQVAEAPAPQEPQEPQGPVAQTPPPQLGGTPPAAPTATQTALTGPGESAQSNIFGPSRGVLGHPASRGLGEAHTPGGFGIPPEQSALRQGAIEQHEQNRLEQPEQPEPVELPPPGADPQIDREVATAAPSEVAGAVPQDPSSVVAGTEGSEIGAFAQAKGKALEADKAASVAKGAAAEEKLRIEREAQAERDEAFKRIQGDRLERLAQLDAKWDELLTRKIEPKTLWKDGSTAQQILGGMSAVLGGMLMVRGYTGGRNPGVDMIDGWIERDLKAQMANFDKDANALGAKERLYNRWLDATQDELAAKDLAKASALTQVGLAMEAEFARIDAGPRHEANVQAALSDIYKRARELSEHGMDRALKVQEHKSKLMNDRARRAQTWANIRNQKERLAFDKEKFRTQAELARAEAAAKAGGGVAGEKDPYVAFDKDTIIDPRTGKVIGRLVGTAASKNAARVYLAKTNAGSKAMADIVALSNKINRAWQSGGANFLKSTESIQLKSQWMDAIDRLVRERSGAQTNENEFKRFMEILPYSSLLSNPEATRDAIANFAKNEVDRAILEVGSQMRDPVKGAGRGPEITAYLQRWGDAQKQVLDAALQPVEDIPETTKTLLKQMQSNAPDVARTAAGEILDKALGHPRAFGEAEVRALFAIPRENRTVLQGPGLDEVDVAVEVKKIVEEGDFWGGVHNDIASKQALAEEMAKDAKVPLFKMSYKEAQKSLDKDLRPEFEAEEEEE